MARLLSAVLAAAVVLGAASSIARADLQAGLDAYFDGDFGLALENLQPAAEADDPIAQFFLGEMYLHGKGVDQDFEQAAHWYERAALNGHPEVQAAIGSLEMLGLGVAQHRTSGYFWLIASVVWVDSELRRAAVPEWRRSQ
jgi:TPR repeat protein